MITEFISQLQEQLKQQFIAIEQETRDKQVIAERSLQAVAERVRELKTFMANYRFTDAEEEVAFFKHQMPPVYSWLIYYLRIYEIECKMPKTGKDLQKEFLHQEYRKIKDFLWTNMEFKRYMSVGTTALDELYFRRSDQQDAFSLEDYSYLIADSVIATPHSFKAAQIAAFESLLGHIEQTIGELDNTAAPRPRARLRFTGKKAYAIELVYALYATRVINNGDAGIQPIASAVEEMFGIDLGNYYRVGQGFRIRKNPTVFVDFMKECLNKYYDEADENPRYH